ncbi:MAG TPA: DUF2334 domain-containing protein [Rhodothermales bacterium]|nr:DUF2334 domain-containing protein [Rhodothermales bacterium]
MNARYIVRLDDACPTMDATRWGMLEEMLDDLNIRPLVAVVPDNRDPTLQLDQPDPRFWEKVHAWIEKGWTIAMHGYQHVFHTVDRRRLVLPFYDRSEFAGLPYHDQAAKIRASWDLFRQQGIEPKVWIAPAHCFDRVTLQAIREETSIRIVSDGIARDQFYRFGFFWLPQQLWSLEAKRSGLWTVCLHPNSMSVSDIKDLKGSLASDKYRVRVVSAEFVICRQRRRSPADLAYATYFWQRSRLFSAVHRLRTLARA